MRTTLDSIVLPQLDDWIERGERLLKLSQFSDLSGIPTDKTAEFIAAAMASIHRVAGPNSPYMKQATKSIESIQPQLDGMKAAALLGTLRAIRHDVESGYLTSIQEIIHGDIFTDFLEMAEHLLSSKYKDAAAVIIGGVLEQHLRKLCEKNSIATDVADSKGTVKPKSVETMNADLAGAGVYAKGDQKNITAWYDLRTNAAHGHYTKYTLEQVNLLLQSVRDFLARYPA